MSVAIAVKALRDRLGELNEEKERIEETISILENVHLSNQNGEERIGADFHGGKPVQKKERKPRSSGVGANVLAYIREHGESNTADVAKALGLEASQVAQALTAGKKKGLFESLGRGVWKVGAGVVA